MLNNYIKAIEAANLAKVSDSTIKRKVKSGELAGHVGKDLGIFITNFPRQTTIHSIYSNEYRSRRFQKYKRTFGGG